MIQLKRPRIQWNKEHGHGPEAIFEEYAEKGDDCWRWKGHVRPDGYAVFVSERKHFYAHRFSWELYNQQSIPVGFQVDHLCRNRSCVNPLHMQLVTLKQNVLSGIGKSAQNARKSHCPQGHPYSKENTYYSKGSRYCRECGRQRCREYQMGLRSA